VNPHSPSMPVTATFHHTPPTSAQRASSSSRHAKASSPTKKTTSPKGSSPSVSSVLTASHCEDRYVRPLQAKLAMETDELERDNQGMALKAALGVALSTHLTQAATTLNDFVKLWARGGTGSIKLLEFRQHVRKWVDKPNVKEVDALFGELDRDCSGSLDVAELKVAMQAMMAEAKAMESSLASARERMEQLEQRVAQAASVVGTTRAAEATEARLAELRQNESVNARLGARLVARNTKIGDLINEWDATKGEMNLLQFRRNVKSFGLEATNAEIDGLFAELDGDGGGTLDVGELQVYGKPAGGCQPRGQGVRASEEVEC